MPEACRIDGCIKKAHARLLCPMHYQRWRTAGDLGGPTPVRLPQRGTCNVGGCTNPKRKTGWCAAHYSQYRRTGRTAPFSRKWASVSPCVVCGRDTTASELRQFCSNGCYQLHRIYDGLIPEQRTCAGCGTAVKLRDGTGRRVRSDVKLCRRCRQDKRKHGVSALWLAQRDGTVCGICQCQVDMGLRFPDDMRASVDHVIPRARGGTNEPTNLQLAHLHCNRVKSDRTPDVTAVSR